MHGYEGIITMSGNLPSDELREMSFVYTSAGAVGVSLAVLVKRRYTDYRFDLRWQFTEEKLRCSEHELQEYNHAHVK